MKKRILLLFFMLLGITMVYSQQVITGTVVDEEDREAIPGVNVIIKGTNSGTVTDMEGNFSINASPDNILVFSFIGYDITEVPVGTTARHFIRLRASNFSLEELIVVGYGTQKKSDLTGSVAAVNAEDLRDVPAPGIDRALQGRVAGVQINANGGAPGSGTSIRIRGMGSIYSGNSPLFVVDGVPLADNVSLENVVNASDIDRIDILKDAASAAIYGSRGSNGVVIVTTKRGQAGKPTITFNSYKGVTNPVNSPDLADAEEYVRLAKLTYANADRPVPAAFLAKEEGEWGKGTNWWDEILRSGGGSIENHDFSMTGGTEDFRYATSLGYFDQKGYIKSSDYSRINFSVNTDYRFLNYFQFGSSVRYSQSERRGVDEDNPEGGAIALAYQISPLESKWQTEDELANTAAAGYDISKVYNQYSAVESTSNYNIARALEQDNAYDRTRSLFGNVFLQGEFLDERLVLRSEFGINVITNDFYNFSPEFYSNATERRDQSVVSRNYDLNTNWVNTNTATYSQSVGRHTFSLMTGFTREHFRFENLDALGRETPSDNKAFWYIDSTTGAREAYGGAREHALMSYLGRAFYSYDNRYMVTANVRRDGTSRFSASNNNRWGVFPSVSAGWNLHQESFFQSLNLLWVNSIKFRGSWGQIGNQSIPNNAYVFSILQRPDTRYAFGREEVFQTGYLPANNANPLVRWETQETLNFGADMSFLRNKIEFTFDYFERTTLDNLLVLPQPLSSGTNDFWANAGEIQNRGIELTARYRDFDGAFKYSFGGNISFVKNEVISLGTGVENLVSEASGRIGGSISNTFLGHPIAEYYGFKTMGIFQTQEQVNNYVNAEGNLIQPNAKPGDFIFADLAGAFDENGNPIPDGQINDEDRTSIGTPHPKFSYGFNISAKYKGFDLDVFLQGQYGNQIFMYQKFYNYKGYNSNFNQVAGIDKNAWSGEGSTNTEPILNHLSRNNNHRLSDWWLSDGSYMRVKNITFGYNLPSRWLDFISQGAAMKLYVTGENLITFTNYEGLDPELGSAGSTNLELGVDRYVYPVGRTFLGGVRLTF